MNKIIDGLNEALVVAKCDHALVMTPKQPSDKRYVRQFCPRCEGTFLSPFADPEQVLRVVGQSADRN
ncbi:hypothetical protein [Pseudorhodoplanes sinuspersici]|uniref:Uncharacterized protein n=1 Tax=Pseudorhodoplanes sinuspersici TaxID=1235591 RepID=A0A1W6ZXL1_9HYPH|nr:hypothetical protein [Pseudorhodoplanes sinuspersici]ARQ01871.1 hypothetical protein CAK95_24325 [Pseudorhodoplanes sinuspersici]RKE73636.1 hypothetical protein DFP91_1530 [Pseudorhodoplanes sinuspersici]